MLLIPAACFLILKDFHGGSVGKHFRGTLHHLRGAVTDPDDRICFERVRLVYHAFDGDLARFIQHICV